MGDEPGCVKPSIVVVCVIVGRGVAGAIVWTPEPGIANWIVCGPALPLASRIAWRNEPAPESAVFVTVNVAALRGMAAMSRTARRKARIMVAGRAVTVASALC